MRKKGHLGTITVTRKERDSVCILVRRWGSGGRGEDFVCSYWPMIMSKIVHMKSRTC